MAATFAPAAAPATVAPFGAITVHRVGTVLWDIAAGLCAWNDNRRTINALRALTPTQLDDIGLTSNDIDDLVRKGL